MAYALNLLAFSGLMAAQAVGALFACLYPWHRVHSEHRNEQAAVSASCGAAQEGHRDAPES